MAYKALYREYRPQKFSEVVGQKAIVETLRNSIVRDRIAHAYLFCGPRGTGKTSIAKIFAKAVNCPNFDREPCGACENCREITEGTHPDVIEMDAASNNSVDDVRDVIDKVKYSPLKGKYKVYIIDEVHMLSQGAFNALLKTLEEPPSHVIFILATTEPLKVPSTIISRCQRYDFGRISEADIAGRLGEVAEKEKIPADEKSLRMIARLSQGGMRDALSILDQCVSYSPEKIGVDEVTAIYGLVSGDEMVDLLRDVKEGDPRSLFRRTDAYWSKGVDVRRLTEDLLNAVKEALVYSYIQDAKLLSRIDEKEAEALNELYTSDQMVRLIDLLLEALGKYRVSENAASYFEITLLKMKNLLQPSDAAEREKSEEKADRKKEQPSSKAERPQEEKKPEKQDSKAAAAGISTYNSADEMVAALKSLGVPEDVLKSADEDVSRETVQPEQEEEQDPETLLGILVQAEKSERVADNKKWEAIAQHRQDPADGEYASLLESAKILASSEESMIVTVPRKEDARKINDANEDGEISGFLQKILGRDKFLIALTEEETDQLISLFKKRRSEGTLPDGSASVPEEKKEEAQRRESPDQAEPAEEEIKEPAPQSESAGQIAEETPQASEEEDSGMKKMAEMFGEGNFDVK